MADEEKLLTAWIEIRLEGLREELERGYDEVKVMVAKSDIALAKLGSVGKEGLKEWKTELQANLREQMEGMRSVGREAENKLRTELKSISETERAKLSQAQATNRTLTRDYENRNKRELQVLRSRMESEAEETKRRGGTTPLEMFGHGTGLRRVVATALSDAFGDAPWAQMAAGVGGILAGSVLLRLGWGIGNLIMNIPKALEKGGEMRYQEGMVSAGATAPGEGAEYAAIEKRERRLWSRSGVDFKGYGNALMMAQQYRMKPLFAEQAINQMALLGVAGGLDPKDIGESSSAYIKMLARHDASSRGAVVGSNRFIADEIRNMNRAMFGRLSDAKLAEMATEGIIGTEDVTRAVFAASRNPIVRQRASYAMGMNYQGALLPGSQQFSPQQIRAAEYEWGLMRAGRPWQSIKAGAERELGINPVNSVMDMPGLSGAAPGGPWQMHPEYRGRQYEFTSLADLAERMQTQAAGMDIAEESNDYLRTIATNTTVLAGAGGMATK